MRQIERSRTAGRCRRFAYPAAIVGLVDGLGRALRPAEGFFPESTAVVDAYTGLLDLSNGVVLGWFSKVTGSLTDLLPGSVGAAWWLPVLLAVLLLWLGRTAARHTAKARRRLGSYRMAVVGSVLMLVLVLSTGLVALGSGVLIPLDGLLG